MKKVQIFVKNVVFEQQIKWIVFEQQIKYLHKMCEPGDAIKINKYFKF